MIVGLDRLRAALERLDVDAVARASLARQAEALAEDIRAELDHAPSGDHATPWRQTGALQSSIAVAPDEAGAAVGSTDPVAADQELGTRTIPPRPFLAPAAAAHAPVAAEAVGAAVAHAIEEATR